MPLPESLARFNRRVANRFMRPLAARAPGLGVIRHTGRRSGRVHRTPVNVFRTREGFVIALTYGPQRDWVKNVLSAGGCQIETRGEIVSCIDPRVVKDQRLARIPTVIRPALKALGVTEVMELQTR